jgi:hypothetical protein
MVPPRAPAPSSCASCAAPSAAPPRTDGIGHCDVRRAVGGQRGAAAVFFAARSFNSSRSTAFTGSCSGTTTVNAFEGANPRSSSTSSGQHYLRLAESAHFYALQMDDDEISQGRAAMPPLVDGRSAVAPWNMLAAGQPDAPAYATIGVFTCERSQ